MSQIGISFTSADGAVHDFVFTNFGDTEMPRSYQSTASFTLSANGTSILGGPAYRQKYQWVLSSIVETEEALLLDALFQAWDTDRAQGLPAACGITDQTFGAEVLTSAVFATPPSYNRLSPRLTLVSFGLEEV